MLTEELVGNYLLVIRKESVQIVFREKLLRQAVSDNLPPLNHLEYKFEAINEAAKVLVRREKWTGSGERGEESENLDPVTQGAKYVNTDVRKGVSCCWH